MVSALEAARAAARERVSITPRGTNFVRRIIAEGLAKARTGNAIEIASSRWGASSSVVQNIEKANKPAGVTSGGWGGDFIPAPEDAAEFFAAADARSIPGQLPGIRTVPFNVGSLGIVQGTGVDWVREGFGVPVGVPVTYKVAGLDSFKLAVITVVTEDLLRDSDPRVEAAIRQDLLNSAAYALNAAFIDPSNVGVASTKPSSVTSGQGPTDSPAETFADTGDIIESLISGQDFAGDLERSVLIMHPATGARMQSAAHPLVGVRGGQLFGFPVIVSSAVPTNIVVLIDPTAVLFATDGGGELSVSNAGTCELTDAPTSASTGASGTPTQSTSVSLFQTNSVGVLLTRRANWAMAKPNCVSYVNISVG